MSDSYCVKCRKKTVDTDPKIIITAKGRYRRAASCSECGAKKSSFVKKPTGGSEVVTNQVEEVVIPPVQATSIPRTAPSADMSLGSGPSKGTGKASSILSKLIEEALKK